MTYELIKEKIHSCKKFNIVEDKETGTGRQLRLDNGAIINCFSNGNHNIQGKNTQEIKEFLTGAATIVNRKVFVVYGHDDIARTQLEAMLRRWDLEPKHNLRNLTFRT